MHYCVRYILIKHNTVADTSLHNSLWIKYDNGEVSFWIVCMLCTEPTSSSSNFRAALAWINNIYVWNHTNTHIRLNATMENQFNSPSFYVAFHFAMPSSSIGLLQNHFALIMDEIDHIHKIPINSSLQTLIHTHTGTHVQANTRTHVYNTHIHGLMVGNFGHSNNNNSKN